MRVMARQKRLYWKRKKWRFADHKGRGRAVGSAPQAFGKGSGRAQSESAPPQTLRFAGRFLRVPPRRVGCLGFALAAPGHGPRWFGWANRRCRSCRRSRGCVCPSPRRRWWGCRWPRQVGGCHTWWVLGSPLASEAPPRRNEVGDVDEEEVAIKDGHEGVLAERGLHTLHAAAQGSPPLYLPDAPQLPPGPKGVERPPSCTTVPRSSLVFSEPHLAPTCCT